MLKYLVIIITVVITSFYYFPFEFVFLPGINTKMALAGLGLIVLGFNLAKHRNGIDRDLFILSLIAMPLSLISLTTMIYNVTNDGSFLTYFISIWVWLGGAYATTRLIKYVHGDLSVRLICNYLIVVCVIQCIVAYTMSVYSPLKEFVDSFLGGEEAFMGKAGDRMYGIGCALDVAGMRFSAVLIMIAYICVNSIQMSKHHILLYILAFLIIGVIGNMIGRTTLVGGCIALLYWMVIALNKRMRQETNIMQLLRTFGIVIMVAIPVMITMYYENPIFRDRIRFGFEGFFALAETGEWTTNSSDILLNHMIVFPETLKTWLIGDGYCANPEVDPYYTGQSYHGFYMGTDIGYLRFLFYFGIFGVLGLVGFICKTAWICIKRFPLYSGMFFMLLLVNLVIWFKVSTDIFLVFAPFLCINKEENAAYMKRVALKNP